MLVRIYGRKVSRPRTVLLEQSREHLVLREELEAVGSEHEDRTFIEFSCCCVAWASQGKGFNGHLNSLEKGMQDMGTAPLAASPGPSADSSKPFRPGSLM